MSTLKKNKEEEYWSIMFPSQMNLRPYGHLICTPVSLLAATSYLNDVVMNDNLQRADHDKKQKESGHSFESICIRRIKKRFTQQFVQQMMVISHQLYCEFFSQKGLQLMIQDLYPWIPPNTFHILEAGGLIYNTASNNDVEDKNGVMVEMNNNTNASVKSLILMPLHSLLERFSNLSRDKHHKISIIVTTNGHSVSFLCSENGALFMFDPLPAMVCSVPQPISAEKIYKDVLKLSSIIAREGDENDIIVTSNEKEYSAVIIMKTEDCIIDGSLTKDYI